MPPAAPVMTAVRPLRENCRASSSESSGRPSGPSAPSGSPCAARLRIPLIMSMGGVSFLSATDRRAGVDAVATLLELGDDLRAQQLEAAHDLLVGDRAELHVAEQLVDPGLVVAHDLLEALLGGAHHDHVLVDVVLDVDRSCDGVLQEREDLGLLLGG